MTKLETLYKDLQKTERIYASLMGRGQDYIRERNKGRWVQAFDARCACHEAGSVLKDLKRPEEKYERALEHYNDVVAAKSSRIGELQAEIGTLQSTLQKPFQDYKRQRRANAECERLASRIEAHKGDIDRAREDMEGRRDKLANFNGHMSTAEKDLLAASASLSTWEAMLRAEIYNLKTSIAEEQARVAARPERTPKPKPPVPTAVRVILDRIPKEDIEALIPFKSVCLQNGVGLEVSGSKLKEILKVIPTNSEILWAGGLRFEWPTDRAGYHRGYIHLKAAHAGYISRDTVMVPVIYAG